MSLARLSIIPARAATDRALKPRDLQVLCVLGRSTDNLGWCRRSQVKMAEEMGCARSTVFEAIERLIEAGYLERHVQVEDNGRDSPHVYRVVLDPQHPDPGSVPEEADAPAPPADIPAPPPAGISAPPADPGPAPKNDSLRTNLRESARASEESQPAEDPKKIDAAGWALLRDWPDFAGMPKEPALKVWRSLDAAERAEAARKFPAWLALLRRQRKSHTPAPSTYLGQKLWREVPEPVAAGAAAHEAKPFSKLWMARLYQLLLAGPTVQLPGPTSFERTQIDGGKATAEQLRREKSARYGFPAVNAMLEKARFGQAVTVPASLAALALPMAQLWPDADAETIAEWQFEHQRRGWPWLPEFRRDRPLFFPPGGPEEGLAALGEALRAAGKDEGHDGDRHQAAE